MDKKIYILISIVVFASLGSLLLFRTPVADELAKKSAKVQSSSQKLIFLRVSQMLDPKEDTVIKIATLYYVSGDEQKSIESSTKIETIANQKVLTDYYLKMGDSASAQKYLYKIKANNEFLYYRNMIDLASLKKAPKNCQDSNCRDGLSKNLATVDKAQLLYNTGAIASILYNNGYSLLALKLMSGGGPETPDVLKTRSVVEKSLGLDKDSATALNKCIEKDYYDQKCIELSKNTLKDGLSHLSTKDIQFFSDN